MVRLGLLWAVFCLLCFRASGQCVVTKNDKGKIITTCQVYVRENGGLLAGNHIQVVYLGSEYFTFPVTQQGYIQLGGKEIACRLTYSVASNEVWYQLNHSTTVERIRPEAFTLDGHRFIRQSANGPGKSESYFMVLSDGKTKLLKSIKSELRVGKGDNGYVKADEFQGYYHIQESYYLKKGNAYPESISLTAKSVLSVLDNQSAKLSAQLAGGKLTPEAIIEVLKYYDTLPPDEQTVSEELKNKPALSRDPLFNQVLRDKVTYPGQAKYERVYGRIYTGFEIDKAGQIQNIVVLSPQNAGYGFDIQVKQALKKLPILSPEYEGKYVLPVAFTFSAEKQPAYVPVNKLPPDRMENRIELDEITVSASLDKSAPGVESREVWGYYK
jgi:hypothetical protein